MLLSLIITAICATQLFLSGGVSAASNGQGNELTSASGARLIVQDYNNPISLSEINSLKNAATNESAQSVNSTSIAGEQPYGLPNLTSGEVIAAFGYVIDEHGDFSEFFGVASNASDMSFVKTQSQVWWEAKLAQRNDSEQGYSARGPYWAQCGTMTCPFEVQPYGATANSSSLFFLYDDNDPNSMWWGVQQFSSVTPGYAIWSGDSNRNDNFTVTQNWGSKALGCYDLQPNNIEGAPVSTTTMNVGYGADGASASWGLSYSQPNITTTPASNYTNMVKWSVVPNDTPTKQSMVSIAPGSTWKTSTLNSGDLIVTTKVDAWFFDNWFDHELVSSASWYN